MHRLAKAIAGLVIGLERLDALVFTGGIGENSAVVRSMVLSRLRFLGLTEDAGPMPTMAGAPAGASASLVRSWRSSSRRTRSS